MDETIPRLPPKVERSGNVVVLTFSKNRRDLDNVLADELDGPTGDLAGCHLLLDFSNVALVGSEELGTLVGLSRRLRACGGRLTLFNLSPPVYEVFVITRLHTVLGICRESN
jgi:anti-anti-sigma factor